MDYFTRSLLRPEHIEADSGKPGKLKLELETLDGKALELAKSAVLLSKIEVSKPPPAPKPRERLPVGKQDQPDSDCPDSDTESIYSLASQCSNKSTRDGRDGHGFPAVLSCTISLEEKGSWWSHGPEEDLLQAVARYTRW
mmetsp:Transcript_69899/g.110518  ORF Transcript_69899/g.110518 Transcript_69899/m.110518 type:complete len:140 (+) Transcript_69899:74-493(+)